MTYIVGRDREGADGEEPVGPLGSARGVFANWFQGATPKYAINEGTREDFFRDTLARIFVRLTENEMALFASSISDSHVKSNLISRLAGSPAGHLGYIDFLIGQMGLGHREKFQISETLGDNFVMFAFGQSAPVLQVSGMLLNTVQDDQSTNFHRLYLHILRATQLARRLKAMSLKVDSYIFTGAMTNLDLQWTGAMEVAVPFSFQFVVSNIAFVNTTNGWRPTGVGTPFSTDRNAVPLDTRLRSGAGRAATAVTLSVPSTLAPVTAEEQQTQTQTPGEQEEEALARLLRESRAMAATAQRELDRRQTPPTAPSNPQAHIQNTRVNGYLAPGEPMRFNVEDVAEDDAARAARSSTPRTTTPPPEVRRAQQYLQPPRPYVFQPGVQQFLRTPSTPAQVSTRGGTNAQVVDAHDNRLNAGR